MRMNTLESVRETGTTVKQEIVSLLDKLPDDCSAEDVQYHLYVMEKVRRGLNIPFDIEIPNKTTIKTFKDTDAGRNLVECKNAEDMFNKLGI